MTFPHPHNRPTTTHTAGTANTPPSFSKEQAIAQVVDAAKQIVTVAQLQHPEGNSWFGSCNDQGDPPYKGRVAMSFDRPADVDEASYYQQIAEAMLANGWAGGSKPGERHHGTVLHKDGVTAMMNHNTKGDNVGIISLDGECRVTGPERLDSAGSPIDFGP